MFQCLSFALQVRLVKNKLYVKFGHCYEVFGFEKLLAVLFVAWLFCCLSSFCRSFPRQE